MHSLATGYCVSGRHDEAIALHQETIRLRRKHLGIKHPDTLISMVNLADTYERADRHDEAIQWWEDLLRLGREHLSVLDPSNRMFEERLSNAYLESGTRRDEYFRLREGILQFRREHLGLADQRTLDAMNQLVDAYRTTARHDEAVRVSQKRLDLTRNHLGLNSQETARAAGKHGSLLCDVGGRDEALRISQEMLDLSREALGSDHPQTGKFMADLAGIYRGARKYDDAIRLSKLSLDHARQHLGPDDKWTLDIMKSLAGTYLEAGRWHESIRLEEEILSQHRHRWRGRANFSLVYQMQCVAGLHRNYGQHDRAIPVYEEMLDLCRAQLSPEHVVALSRFEVNHWRVLTRDAMNGLGVCYRGVDRYAEAIKMHEELVQFCHDYSGPENEPTFESMHALAHTYEAAGRHAEAIEVYEALLHLRRKRHGPEHPYTLEAIECLAELCASAGSYSEASRVLEERVCFERKRNRYHHLARTLARLTDYLLADNRYTEAEVLAGENLAICQRQMVDNPNQLRFVWDTYRAQVNLGRSLAGQKRLVEAERLLVNGCRGMDRTGTILRDPRDARYADEAMSTLVQFYEDLDKPEKAEQWRWVRDPNRADLRIPIADEEGPADQAPQCQM
jgi:tetratricopeptide (TPR) repeat protein